MPRVALEHIEINEEAGRVSVTGTVDDSPAAASIRLIRSGMTMGEYRKMSAKARELFLAIELVKAKKERPAVPGKHYIEVKQDEPGSPA